jgi:hypothetical protein
MPKGELPREHFPLGGVAGEFYNDGRSIVTLRPFRYVDKEHGIDVTVPALFTSDGNSSPQPAWWFFSKWDYPAAPVMHDWVFRHPPAEWTRENCDWVHWRLLRLSGCPGWKAEVVFQFLSKGSKGAWDRHRQREQHA